MRSPLLMTRAGGYNAANYTGSLYSWRARFPGSNDSTGIGARRPPPKITARAKPRKREVRRRGQGPFCMCLAVARDDHAGARTPRIAGPQAGTRAIGRNKVSCLPMIRGLHSMDKNMGKLDGNPSPGDAPPRGDIGTFAPSSSSRSRNSCAQKKLDNQLLARACFSRGRAQSRLSVARGTNRHTTLPPHRPHGTVPGGVNLFLCLESRWTGHSTHCKSECPSRGQPRLCRIS